MLTVCVAGKNNIAVNVLNYLYFHCDERYSLCVVCNKAENGINNWQHSLRQFALRKGIPEYELEELYSFEDLVFLSIQFDRIINPQLFKSERLFNIHFSLLPAYKGMYTSIIPILNNESKVGVTLHRIDQGIDTGDIIAQKEFLLESDYTSRDLYFKYIQHGTELMLENLEKILENNFSCYKQSAQGSSYYSKKCLDYKNIAIDLNQTALNIRNQIRAFSFREYQLPKVFGHNIVSANITEIRSKQKPGQIISRTDTGLLISSIDYNVILNFDRLEELFIACRTGDVQTVESICFIKEHINASDENGRTPLMIGTSNNQVVVVKKLLSLGADLFAKDYEGANLLVYAKEAFKSTGDDALLQLFLQLGLM